MQLSPTILAIQYLAVAILFFELIFALNQKSSDLQKYVILLTVSTIVMFIGYNIELTSSNLEEALAGTGVSYIGKPFVMLFSFLFIATFYGKKIPRTVINLLALYSTSFCIIVFENYNHHLYYATTEYLRHDAFSPLITTRGPLYYLYVVTAVLFFFACITIAIGGMIKTKSKQKKELSVWIILMIVSGITGYAVYLTGLTGGYDATMSGVFGSVLCLFILFIKCRIFDNIAEAKDQALNDSLTGLIIMNVDEEVVFKNAIIKELSKKGVTIDQLINYDNKNDGILQLEDRFYRIDNKQIINGDNNVGRIVEVTDVTISKNYQGELEKEVKERTEQVETIQRSIIASMANIVEARSLETGEHIKRTSDYTEMIAKALVEQGDYLDILTPKYINLLVSAAPLHDIGKIAVSDTILLKPGKLTEEEHKQMQVHVVAGGEIIENTMRGLESDEYVALASDVVKYHHERWDGTGYTQHMKGEEIPLSARIVSLADCFDALASKRCYKEAYSIEKALEIVKSESGTHFDPKVVKAFLKAMEKTM